MAIASMMFAYCFAFIQSPLSIVRTCRSGQRPLRFLCNTYTPNRVCIGDPALSRKELDWVPKTSFEELVAMMVDSDVKIVKEAVKGGYEPPIPPE